MVACLCDEISDIIYVITNWDTFKTDSLKTASIFFIVFPYFINFLMGLYLLSIANGVKNMGRDGQIALICCCWWLPLTILLSLLLWTKILGLLDYLEVTLEMFDRQNRFLKDVIKYSTVFELFSEDLPQIIIQSVNNS